MSFDPSTIFDTFVACAKSIGTAITLAGAGAYMHRRGFVNREGGKLLALICQQLTFPLLLFTKILYCEQDGSDDPCPDLTESLQDLWILLVWPMFMVGSGLVVGNITVRLAGTPRVQHKPVVAAVTFANNTALPITLLSVVHANYDQSTVLGSVDPTIFLSVYLIIYPILQWGLGGWMLSGDDVDVDEEEEDVDELDLTVTTCDVDEEDSEGEEEDEQDRNVALCETALRPKEGVLSRNVLNNSTEWDRAFLNAGECLHMKQTVLSIHKELYPTKLLCSVCHAKAADHSSDENLSVPGDIAGNVQNVESPGIGDADELSLESPVGHTKAAEHFSEENLPVHEHVPDNIQTVVSVGTQSRAHFNDTGELSPESSVCQAGAADPSSEENLPLPEDIAVNIQTVESIGMQSRAHFKDSDELSLESSVCQAGAADPSSEENLPLPANIAANIQAVDSIGMRFSGTRELSLEPPDSQARAADQNLPVSGGDIADNVQAVVSFGMQSRAHSSDTDKLSLDIESQDGGQAKEDLLRDQEKEHSLESYLKSKEGSMLESIQSSTYNIVAPSRFLGFFNGLVNEASKEVSSSVSGTVMDDAMSTLSGGSSMAMDSDFDPVPVVIANHPSHDSFGTIVDMLTSPPLVTNEQGGQNFLRFPNHRHPCFDLTTAAVGSEAIPKKTCKTLRNVLNRAFQPPVVGAILGIIVGVTPIRGVFVDEERNGQAPLQWLFDGMYVVGTMAVPINMMVLGCNLSSTLQKSKKEDQEPAAERDTFSKSTLLGIAVAKLIVLPSVGFVATVILKNKTDVPEEFAASLYLMLMVVFLTPTANNVMVMVELSGSNTKEAIASAIAWQYVAAPVLLTLSLTVAVGVATDWA